ncbi:sialidase family protein [Parapedobacter sp. 2B3]|uniref:sialidase family protein n=1 Tax=Parapedobacter sp. 2B3 TaxID=3342381 RepID=UPI0035B5F508
MAFSILACSQEKDNDVIAQPPEEPSFSVYPANFPNNGILFVDHESSGRSGHGGQTMTECTNGDIIAFYSNVKGDINNGHNVAGWAEYKISSDGGETWSEPYVFGPSKEIWDNRADNGLVSLLIWEVLTASDGTIVAFGRTSGSETKWGGDAAPVYFLSHDNGRTWSSAKRVDSDIDSKIDREEAAIEFNQELLVLYCEYYATNRKYRLYVSSDNGASFEERSTLPFPSKQEYGTIGILPDGKLIVYTYNGDDDGALLQYVTSEDGGRTWSYVRETKMARRIRKPRMTAQFGDHYFMIGRSGNSGPDPRHLVLYTSKDGINWDEGIFLNKGGRDTDSYSANEIIGKYGGSSKKRLLIQSSICYEQTSGRVNLRHWFVDIN